MQYLKVRPIGDKILLPCYPRTRLSSACGVRYLLVSKFKRQLDHYTEIFSDLLDRMSTERASAEISALYDSCIEARKALQTTSASMAAFSDQELNAGRSVWFGSRPARTITW